MSRMIDGRGPGSRLAFWRQRGDRHGETVLSASPRVAPSQLAACTVGLLASGVFLARGFIGLQPGRPAALIAGFVLAAWSVIGLAADHIAVRAAPEKPEEALQRELNRSRRHVHALALVRFLCDAGQATQVIGRLRSTDQAWWDRGNHLVVLLPETERDEAVRFVGRIHDLLPSTPVQLAAFPDDGLTNGALLDALREHPGFFPGSIPTELVTSDSPDQVFGRTATQEAS